MKRHVDSIISELRLLIKKIVFTFFLIYRYFFKNSKHINESLVSLGQRDIYDSKYLLRIINKFFVNTKQFSLQERHSSSKIGDSKHIVICLSGLMNSKTKSHSFLYYSWAKKYLEANSTNRVTFFLTGEHSYLGKFVFGKSRNSHEYFNEFKTLKYESNDSRFNYEVVQTTSVDLAVNVEKACKQILDLNPSHLVFFSGWNCDSPLVRSTLFNFKPIIFHMTQGTHSLPTHAHLMIDASSKNHWRTKRRLPVVDIDNYFIGQKESRPLDLYDNESTIKNFRNSKKPVVIATIISGKRIFNTLKRYSKNELNILIDYVENSNIIWYWIGVVNEDEIRGISKELDILTERKKIVILKFMNSIDDFLVDVDIYCHLPRLIGGGGISSKALNKKAVLICDSSSDVSRRLESQYIFDDFTTFFKNMEELTKNVEKRIEIMTSQNLYINRYPKLEIYKRTKKKLEYAEEIYNSCPNL